MERKDFSVPLQMRERQPLIEMLSLLLVEDDNRTRDLFSQFFHMKGYQVHEARNGEEAVDMACRQSFDLVLMDVKMPRVDGLEAFHRIRQVSPSSKVLLMTGFGMSEELESLLKEPTVAYVHKPCTFDQLLTVIGDLMAANASQDPADGARPGDDTAAEQR